MKFRYLALIATLSFSATAFASNHGEELFKSSGCNVCHKIDTKSVGPSFKSIGLKYKGDKAAQVKLEKKVRHGGSGSFGSMSMPPTTSRVSDESIATIVKWALTLK
ncbi:MAG: c-type cytochrome [Gallionella sp.]